MVFEYSYWSKSEELFESIARSSFEKLVLQEGIKKEILQDVKRFFDSKETYDKYGIPWKRGLLLIGPPGNGKTGAIKALVNELGLPCLYVKSLDSDSPEDDVGPIFAQARESAPCILVLEDLDSLITEKCLSVFLNEMDGFAANSGVLVLATTNHPERLDEAILDRPSRFDRKLYFPAPAFRERLEYFDMWNARLAPELQISAPVIESAARATENFSFAFMKELCVSAVLEWMAVSGARPMDEILLNRAAILARELSSAKSKKSKAAAGSH